MEQKAAHTPGPWQIEWNAAQSGEGHYITDSNDMGELSRIAAVLFHDDADGETRANARLLAAAPELLAACKSMIEWDDREHDHAVDFSARMALCDAAFNAARAAIAKAEGGAA